MAKKKVNRKRSVYSVTLSPRLIEEAEEMISIGAYQSRSAFLEDAANRRYKTIMRSAKND